VSEQKTHVYHQVELVYAQALIELAEESGQVDAIGEEVRDLAGLLRDDPQIIKLLANRALSREERDAVFTSAFQGRVSDLVYRVLRVLVSKDRFDEFPGIAAAFAHLMDQRHGTLEVEAFVASPLDEETAGRIRARIGELTKRNVRLEQRIQPEMIGGLKLRVGDELLDGSVATQVRLVKERLIESGQASVRTAAARLFQE
jgi:F-type H+-transporting ATPase subunit delta